ncbi:MAG: cation transporter [Bdellovibrionales bacterium]|nr:cation transporter [Bdellovibrionales bacterium]
MLHDHHHHHHHDNQSSALGMAFLLNVCFALIEIVGGIWTNSVAIISDAIHDFGDALAIGLAWYLEKKSKKAADNNFSYGYKRLSTLSALITGITLLVGSVLVLINSLPRLFHPEQPKVDGMIFLALLGVVVNGIAALRVAKGHSLNSKMISLHLIEDILGWVIVLIAAIVMKFVYFPEIDAILAIILSLWVMKNVFKGLKSSLQIFLQRTPVELSPEAIIKKLQTVSGVKSIHHLHLWSLDGNQHILTSHVVMSSGDYSHWNQIKQNIKELLSHDFKIVEATLEPELSNEVCIDPEHT